MGNNQSTNNATGFGALPAGGYFNNGYGSFGNIAYFWSATEASSGTAWNRYLYNYFEYVRCDSTDKHVGYSVRCLRD